MPPQRIVLPTPFPIGPVNVYLLEADPLSLVDCGPKHPQTLAALENGLAAHGVRIEDIRQLILTHHHVDHVGLAKTIADRSGAQVFTHPFNIPYLSDYEAERIRHVPFYAKIWTEGGVPEEIVDAMRRAGDGMARWLDPVQATRPIDEGDRLTLGGASWAVYHTPGHAGGLVCLHNPQTGELIANDHLLRDISSNPVLEPPPTGGATGPRPKRLVEYLHHMRRMAALHPAIAYPGHGEPVSDVAALVHKRLAFHRRRARRILETLDSQALTLWELTQRTFPTLTRGMDFFLAHSEVLGHLDILAEEEKVEAVAQGRVVRWKTRA